MNSYSPQLTLRRRGSQSGIALVIVLTMLVLLSALLVAFMSSASTETQASKASAQQLEARQAADAAVNFVIGQIRDATTGVDDGASPDSSKGATGFTWASQPGAIRTYGSGSGTVYKLYSAEKLREAENTYAANVVKDAGTSSTDPDKDGYVDMNEPALVPVPGTSGSTARYEARYPILNPYGKYNYTFSGTKGTFNVSSNPNPGEGAIEGFYCETTKDTAGRKDPDNNDLQYVPMRVKWMYILKNGAFATVDDSGKISGASKDNPPVARTAFWTDDESCKININTATEGTYWDVPSVGTRQESGDVDGSGNVTDKGGSTLNLAVSQPARNEFQRYPGHPATTCLSPALRWLFPNYKNTLVTPSIDPDLNFKETIYRMAPRVVGGGSSPVDGGGTSRGTSMAGTNNTDPLTTNVLTYKAVQADKDRLFATLDEYFFRPDRTARNAPPVYDPNPAANKEVKIAEFLPEQVDKLRFFLTANSRTPELNMFGRPRVTIWPINLDPAKQTAFDDMFQFCSTLGNKGYNFLRSNPQSATVDALIPQNARLYAYLQDQTQRKIPWTAKSFLDKYDVDRDQILTEIFDYVRTTNLVDTSTTKTGVDYGAAYTPFYWPGRNKQATMPAPYSGQVTPSVIPGTNGSPTQGFGRFPTVAEAALVFYRASSPIPGGGAIPAGNFVIGCAVALEMFNPAQGFPALRDTYSVRIRANNFQMKAVGAPGGTTMFPPDASGFSDMFNMVTVDGYTSPVARVFMPFRGFANQFLYDTGWNGLANFTAHSWDSAARKSFTRQTFTGRDNKVYPFYSDTLTIPTNAGQFQLVGGTFKIEIYGTTNPGANDAPVQSMTINFPNATLPVPAVGGTDFQLRLTKGLNGNRNNLTAYDPNSGLSWIENQDVIRSMEIGGVTKGDIRLALAQPVVPASFYTPRGGMAKYTSSALQVHGLRTSRGNYYPSGSYNTTYNGTEGSLSPNAPYRSDRRPRVPVDQNGNAVNGVTMENNRPGDWDRGISKNVDGPFINHADEGNQNFDLTRTGGTRLPYYLGYSGFEEAGPTFFSPNRLIPSAVMFGSLSTKVRRGPGPWQTLLFRPESKVVSFSGSTGGTDHPGAQAPYDHYLLDLFHMPVVEPYAISEPFSTAGKININYELAPYGYVKNGTRSYIERKTGLHAVLKSTKMLCVPNSAQDGGHTEDPITNNNSYRYDIDRRQTLNIVQDRLNKKGLFKTASEFCEIPLVPLNLGISNGLTQNWDTFWNQQYAQTGDNQRERPYAHIYPRITTRSNVYTVYVRAQGIRKNPSSDPDVFDLDKDQVTGEYRGQTTIERYIDPKDPALSNYDPTKDTSGAGGGPVDRFYRFRIVNAKQFIGN